MIFFFNMESYTFIHTEEEKGMTEDEMVEWLINSMDKDLSKLWEMVKDREAWGTVVHGVAKSRT